MFINDLGKTNHSRILKFTGVTYKDFSHWGISSNRAKLQKNLAAIWVDIQISGEKLKQLKCPSTVEWVCKIWYSHTVEYYPAIKKNEVLIHVITILYSITTFIIKFNKWSHAIIKHLFLFSPKIW